MDPLFYTIFEQLPRVGPGNSESTQKAYNILAGNKPLPKHPRILDIGCGTGLHTIELAKHSNGKITALDNYPPFQDRLKKRLITEGLSEQINCVTGDMNAMDFEHQSFDIIWAEGSIFIIGIENGLNQWKKFLKPGGMITFSDFFWLKPGTPEEVKVFFEQMCTVLNREQTLALIEKCGYRCIDQFQLPNCAWWDEFHHPLEKVLQEQRQKYANAPDKPGIIEHLQKEIDMIQTYSEYCGYIFFMLEKK